MILGVGLVSALQDSFGVLSDVKFEDSTDFNSTNPCDDVPCINFSDSVCLDLTESESLLFLSRISYIYLTSFKKCKIIKFTENYHTLKTTYQVKSRLFIKCNSESEIFKHAIFLLMDLFF